jgi:hypothetical protein
LEYGIFNWYVFILDFLHICYQILFSQIIKKRGVPTISLPLKFDGNEWSITTGIRIKAVKKAAPIQSMGQLFI